MSLFTITAFSVNLSVGMGMDNLESRFAACADVSLYGEYIGIDNNMTIFHDLGFSNFTDIFLKLNYPITPVIGIGTAFGVAFSDGFFFEDKGMFFNLGLAYYSDDYEVKLNMKQYLNFEGKLGNFPLIQILCRFKIGEW